MLLLTNARLIDGTGAKPAENQAVLLDGKRIAAVGPEHTLDVPPDTDRLDLGGRTLLPGFMDCHVHIMWNPDPNIPTLRPSKIPLRDEAYLDSRGLLLAVNNARKTIEAGFTTIQDLAAPNHIIFSLRDAIAAGEFVGPRIVASGACITHTGGHGTEGSLTATHVADTPDEVFKAVRRQIVAGADCIKYMGGTRPALSPPYRGREGYTTDEMKPGVEEAHRAGLKVRVHAHSSAQGIKNSIMARVDSIEHGFPLDQEGADMMVEFGTYLCPTLSVNPAAVQAIEMGMWSFPGSEDQIRRMADMAPRTIELAVKTGVKVALGTDAAMPMVLHGGNGWEFELMVEYGMSPMQALLAGTRNAAENLGLLADLGTIEAGKLADVVVLEGDPLADIRVLKDLDKIKLVMKEGAVVINRGL